MSISIHISQTALKTHWAIVNQGNLHHGLKDTILNFLRRISLLHLVKEVLIKPLRLIAPKRSVEIRLVALLGRSKQGELRYAEHLPVDILHVPLPLPKEK